MNRRIVKKSGSTGPLFLACREKIQLGVLTVKTREYIREEYGFFKGENTIVESSLLTYHRLNKYLMKKLFFVLLAATALASCKKSEDAVVDPPLTSPGMTAKIDGTVINYSAPSSERQTSTDGTETIFLSAFTTEGHGIELSLSKVGGIAAGEYDSNNGANISISDATDFCTTNKIVNIKITTIDANHVVGTFMGEANNMTSGGVPKSVTNGKFYANF